MWWTRRSGDLGLHFPSWCVLSHSPLVNTVTLQQQVVSLTDSNRKDVIKTRLQTHDLLHHNSPFTSTTATTSATSTQPLLQTHHHQSQSRPSTLTIALTAYRTEGPSVFFRGIGICSARAFVVNAVQWAVRIFRFPFAYFLVSTDFWSRLCELTSLPFRGVVGLRVDDASSHGVCRSSSGRGYDVDDDISKGGKHWGDGDVMCSDEEDMYVNNT